MVALFAIEIVIAVALVIGFMYEEKVAAFEQKVFRKIRRKLRKLFRKR